MSNRLWELALSSSPPLANALEPFFGTRRTPRRFDPANHIPEPFKGIATTSTIDLRSSALGCDESVLVSDTERLMTKRQFSAAFATPIRNCAIVNRNAVNLLATRVGAEAAI